MPFKMSEEHKAKLRLARQAAREARRNAVDAEVAEGRFPEAPQDELLVEADSEVETLRRELAELKEKHREKAPHEHETISGREKINDRTITGVQEEIKESLRELLREQLAEVLPEREVARTTARDTVRPNAVVAHDREGNPIYRRRDATADPFAIPEHLHDPAWDRQWVRISTFGQEDISNQVNMQSQGWRFIEASRPGWENTFMPKGYSGHIFKDGLALMERPMVLTEEAKREAARAVREQSRAQREQFGMALPDGFSGDTPAARQFTFARAGKRETTPSNLKPDLQVRGALDID